MALAEGTRMFVGPVFQGLIFPDVCKDMKFLYSILEHALKCSCQSTSIRWSARIWNSESFQ